MNKAKLMGDILNIKNAVDAGVGSDIRIFIDSIIDSEGNSLNPLTTYFGYSFYDSESRNEYKCIYDPSGIESINTEVKSEKVVLLLDAKKYTFTPGRLRVKGFTRATDQSFSDGYMDSFTDMKIINITLR